MLETMKETYKRQKQKDAFPPCQISQYPQKKGFKRDMKEGHGVSRDLS